MSALPVGCSCRRERERERKRERRCAPHLTCSGGVCLHSQWVVYVEERERERERKKMRKKMCPTSHL